MTKEDKLIFVGVISSAHGIKGDVLVKSYTDPAQNLLSTNLVNENGEVVALKFLREKAKGSLVCKFSGSNDRNHAELLKGTKLYCQREDFSQTLDEEEFYFEDLKNLDVRDDSGNKIGVVSNVANYGAGDIIEIRFDSDSKEEMFSFTKEFFPHVAKDHVVFAKG
ncbi:MAG: ribosome maturation factor RimM [Rickettsiales bacterium]|nr:MAG: ribosome maturation factor RimM [Rickettsiales bacterium]